MRAFKLKSKLLQGSIDIMSTKTRDTTTTSAKSETTNLIHSEEQQEVQEESTPVPASQEFLEDEDLRIKEGPKNVLFSNEINHTSLKRTNIRKSIRSLRESKVVQSILKRSAHLRTSTFRRVREKRYMFGLTWWLKYGDSRVINPTVYYKASGNILGITLVVCWLISMAYNPSVFEDNPLLDRLGYNDFCVGWDTAPARYFGIVG